MSYQEQNDLNEEDDDRFENNNEGEQRQEGHEQDQEQGEEREHEHEEDDGYGEQGNVNSNQVGPEHMNNNEQNSYRQPMDSNGFNGQDPEQGEENEQHYESKEKTIAEQIRENVEDQIKNFEQLVVGKPEETILNIRMHQLALAKVLVFTHGASQFELVKAHTKLGVAYLNYKCFEQAIDHLTMALKKNGNLFGEVKDSQSYHADILTQLGKCYLEVERYEDALELLTKANELHKTVKGENDLSSVETLNCIANCHTKMKDYDRAQQAISIIYDIQTQHYDIKSEQVAFTMVENAKIDALKGDYRQAIEYQNQAIDTLIEIEYNKPEDVAELYQTLSGYYEKNQQINEQVDALQKVKTLTKEIYGETDKRVIKVKRQISITLLKNKQNEESLKELLEIEDLESKVYGENSVQVAKTLRIIGTVKVLIQGANEAQKYFAKAIKIFEENGMKNQVKDTKLKLQMTRGKKQDQINNQYDY